MTQKRRSCSKKIESCTEDELLEQIASENEALQKLLEIVNEGSEEKESKSNINQTKKNANNY
jgi:hypothetical protein